MTKRTTKQTMTKRTKTKQTTKTNTSTIIEWHKMFGKKP